MIQNHVSRALEYKSTKPKSTCKRQRMSKRETKTGAWHAEQ